MVHDHSADNATHLHGADTPQSTADNHRLSRLVDEVAAGTASNSPSEPTEPLEYPAPTQALPPLVLVEGFMSFFDKLLWGSFEKHMNAHRAHKGYTERRRVIFSRTGPVSSMHDRACELFYSIKGGTVDYGVYHARVMGHKRFGKHFDQGLYPSWSRENPLHFLGHSLGGTTITAMQSLIRDGHFGPDAHPDMICSITSVASPFRGTPFVYTLGQRPLPQPDVKMFSIHSFITKSIHTISYISPLIPSIIPLPIPDFFRESRSMTAKEIGFVDYLKQMWKSDWGESRDVISWDATFEGSRQREIEDAERVRELEEYYGPGSSRPKRTWLRSYITCMTSRKSPSSSHHVAGSVLETGPWYPLAQMIGSYDYKAIDPPPFFLTRPRNPYEKETLEDRMGTFGRRYEELGEEYFANDGIVPVFSQWHPGDCSPEHCNHDSAWPLSSSSSSSDTESTSDSQQSSFPPSTFIPSSPTASSSATLTPSSSTSTASTLPSSPHLSHPTLPPDDMSSSTSSSSMGSTTYPLPGIWNVIHIPNTTHISLMPLWMNTRKQKEFWVELGEWLEVVDAARKSVEAEESERMLEGRGKQKLYLF